jgi:predicted outer membrane lipoprotein
MNDDGPPTCAVWYEGMDGVDYDLFETVDEAAHDSAIMEHADRVYRILGLQLASGHTIPAAHWHELHVARVDYSLREAERRENPPAPTPTWAALDPFLGKTVQVELDEPEWLGTDGADR